MGVISDNSLRRLLNKLKTAYFLRSDAAAVQSVEAAEASTISIDSTPIDSSQNLVTSGGVKSALDGKQATLESGVNIKTINNQSILGSGNLEVQGGGGSATWGNIGGSLSNQTDLNGALNEKENNTNKVTNITSGSTDDQYPSAKCVYDRVYDKYAKPATGIPLYDLSSSIQTSLAKADNSVQPETGKGLFSGNYNDLINRPTIPNIAWIEV